jgi:hypothetical protein
MEEESHLVLAKNGRTSAKLLLCLSDRFAEHSREQVLHVLNAVCNT